MLAKSCSKVTLQSCLRRESYDAKFGMDECAQNNYGVTLNVTVQGTKKFNFSACPNFLKRSFPQSFHLHFGQVEGKIH